MPPLHADETIEISPEMLRAGASELVNFNYDFESYEEGAENIFRAMWEAGTKELVRLCPLNSHLSVRCATVHTNRQGVPCEICTGTARRCDCGLGTDRICTRDVCPVYLRTLDATSSPITSAVDGHKASSTD